jgi:membrane protease YdiL (CAAX protease family)
MRQRIIIVSPLLIIASGHIVARIAGRSMGVWAWIPVVIWLWVLFLAAVLMGRGNVRRWLGPPRRWSWWSIAAVAVGLLPLPLFLQFRPLLDEPKLIFCWIAFAAINPLLEELYWRGLLLDATSGWPGWIGVLYSSALFALNHPLTLGVNSIANRHPATLVSTFILGLVWALAYRRTGTLRFAIVGHTAVDLLNLSILAFLNLYVPRATLP